MLPDLRIWLNHFEYHAEHPRGVPDGLSAVLKADERRLIADSIATFQLGEQSEGGTLLRAALRARKPAAVRAAIRWAHRTFFAGVSCVVWLTHRAVLRRAGYGMAGFLRACRAQYAFYLEPRAIGHSAEQVRKPTKMSLRWGR